MNNYESFKWPKNEEGYFLTEDDNILQEMKNENCIYQYLKINLKETGQHYIKVNLVFIFVKNNQTK